MPEGLRCLWYRGRGQANKPVNKRDDDKSEDPSPQEATGIPHPQVWQRSADTPVTVRGVSPSRKANARMNAKGM